MSHEERPFEGGLKSGKRFFCLKCVVYSILINIYLITLIEITEAFPMEVTPGLQLSERFIENTDSASNIRSTDYISTATASLHVVYQPAWFKFSGGYSISPSHDAGDLQSNFLSQEGDFSLSAERPRWSSSLSGKLVSTRFVDQISENNQVLVPQDRNFNQESASLNYSYLLTRISRLSMAYSYTANIYDSAALYNSEIHSVTSSLVYSASPANQFIFSGTGNLYDYQSAGRSKSLFAIADWSHTFDSFTSFQIGAGGGLSSGYKRYFLGDARLARKFKNGESSVSYNRSIGSGGGYTAEPLLNQEVAVRLSDTFLNQLSASVSGAIGKSDSSYSGTDFSFRYWNSAFGLSYPVSKWLTGSLTYSHYDQEFNGLAAGRFLSDQVLISLSSKILPWRF